LTKSWLTDYFTLSYTETRRFQFNGVGHKQADGDEAAPGDEPPAEDFIHDQAFFLALMKKASKPGTRGGAK
jgi:hypothetical protein